MLMFHVFARSTINNVTVPYWQCTEPARKKKCHWNLEIAFAFGMKLSESCSQIDICIVYGRHWVDECLVMPMTSAAGQFVHSPGVVQRLSGRTQAGIQGTR